ncbi:MAG: hypothetical protein ACOX0Z_01520 [Candidatus Nanosyncoccaceae bacterium]|jgi:hypothetical protein
MKTNKLKLIGASLAVTASLALPITGVLAASNTTTIKGTVSSVITISTGSEIDISVTPVGLESRISSAKDTVIINSNHSTGYNLTIAMNGTNQNLTREGGTETIAPVNGTQTSPATLAKNRWGYRVDDVGEFGAGPSVVLSSAEDTTLTFAAIPTTDSPDNIGSSNQPSVSGGDAYDVWYAMNVDTTKPTGTYTGTVIYTATAQ